MRHTQKTNKHIWTNLPVDEELYRVLVLLPSPPTSVKNKNLQPTSDWSAWLSVYTKTVSVTTRSRYYLEQKTPKNFRVPDEIRAHDPLNVRSDALSTKLDDDIGWDRCKLTVSNECWRSGVRTGLSGVCVGVDSGVGVPVVCVSGLQVSSSFGTVEVNMSRMQRHALCHISGENWEPFETTRFSRQLVPDLASCSLSGKIHKRMFRVRDYLHNMIPDERVR